MNVVTPSGARCQRCGMRLARTRGEAWCLACGPVERPVVSLEEARREVEEPREGKTVKRAPVQRVGVGTRYGDGCDVGAAVPGVSVAGVQVRGAGGPAGG